MRVLVTGATGYIGFHICQRFQQLGWQVRALCRDDKRLLPSGVERVVTGDLTLFTGWQAALDECDLAIHTAGLAHVTKRDADYDASAYSRINRDVSLTLAQSAKAVALPRLIFLSSVAAYGDLAQKTAVVETMQGSASGDPYGLSKLEAENGLADILQDTGVQYIMLRPPMVYGESCPGNFGRLVQLVKTRLPLPLGSLQADRTLLALENLLDFLTHVAAHPYAGSGLFNIADDESVTLAQMVRLIGQGLGRPAMIIPMPVTLLRAGARIVGRSEMLEKLTFSLTIDSSLAQRTFDWQARVSPTVAIQTAARSFL